MAAMIRPSIAVKSVSLGVGFGIFIISVVSCLKLLTDVTNSPEEDLQLLMKQSTPSPLPLRAVGSSTVDWSSVLGKRSHEEILSRIARDVPSDHQVEPPLYDPTRPANYSLVTITPEMIQPCGDIDLMCKRHILPVTDSKHFQSCIDKMRAGNYSEDPQPMCRLMNGTNRGAVALVSLPGSGNTWVRGLLEQATGVCTGAVYCDATLRMNGMMGEGLRSGTVLVVKTHRNLNPLWTLDTQKPHLDEKQVNPLWSAAVLIIRNPMDAMVAEWNRLQARNLSNVVGETSTTGSRHVDIVGPESFGKNPNWIRFVHTISQRWQTYFEHWALSGFPVLVVHYEDLKVNTVVTVMRILEFLKFPYSEEEVRDRLSEDFSLFRRTTHPTFEHFSIAQKNYIRSKIKETLALLKESNHGDTLGVEAYINTTMLRHY